MKSAITEDYLFSYSFDSYRSWLVNLKDFSKNHPAYSALIKELLGRNVPVKIKKRKNDVIINFSPNALKWKSDFSELAMFQQCMGLIALVYLDCENDFEESYSKCVEKFKKLQKQPKLFSSLLFVFSYKELQQSSARDIVHLHANPNDQKVVANTRRLFIEFINDFIISIYIILESKVAQYKGLRPSSVVTKCSVESDFENVLDLKDVQKIMGARQAKIIADIHLMLGNYSIAIFYYHAAIDDLFDHKDNLWLAVCSEGLACACFFFSTPGDEKSPVFEIDVETKNVSDNNELNTRLEKTPEKDALVYALHGFSFYAKFFTGGPLFVECHLLGVVLNHCCSFYVPKPQVINICSRAFERLRLSPFMPNHLHLTSFLIKALSKIGFHKRKAPIIISFVKRVIDNQHVPSYTIAIYYLKELLELLNFKQCSKLSRGFWRELCMEILMHLFTIHQLQEHYEDIFRVGLFLLARLDPAIWQSNITAITEQLSSDIPLNSSEPLEHLPYTHLMDCELQHRETPVNITAFQSDQSGGSPFLFYATREENKPLVTLANVGENIVVTLKLENPLPINLPVSIVPFVYLI